MPVLYLWPELGQGAEFRAAANENADLGFQGVGIIHRCAHEFDVIEEFFQALSPVAEDDHAVAGIAARSPEEISAVAAESGRQAVGAAEEVDGAGLAVVLGKGAAVFPVFRGDAIPGFGGFGDDLLPSELIGIPLRECGSGVVVLHHGQLHGQSLRVGDEMVGRKNRHGHGSEVGSAGKQHNYDHGLQPCAARASIR